MTKNLKIFSLTVDSSVLVGLLWSLAEESVCPERPYLIVVVELLSCVCLAMIWTAAHQDPPFFTVSWSLLKFMSIALMMLSNHLILCRPLLLCLRSFPASESFPVIWLFASGGQSIGTSIISPSNEYSGLISFRIDRFDLFAVQGTLKILLQHHDLKASVLWFSVFMV